MLPTGSSVGGPSKARSTAWLPPGETKKTRAEPVSYRTIEPAGIPAIVPAKVRVTGSITLPVEEKSLFPLHSSCPAAELENKVVSVSSRVTPCTSRA